MKRATLGSEIRRFRTKARITLRSFADKIGIAPAYLSDIERDRRRPSEAVLRRIASELGHVGATYHGLDSLNTRLDSDIQEWVAEEPSARQLLRAVRDSGRDPREILREVKRLLKKRR